MKARITKYFDVDELMCPHIIRKGYSIDQMWSFLDPRLLTVMVFIREKLNKPIYVNGNSFTQRGLRCNCCELVKTQTNKNNPYLSAHVRGTGLDFDVPGMTAENVRKFIATLDLPYPVRIESDVNWVHIDVDNYSEKLIQYFKG